MLELIKRYLDWIKGVKKPKQIEEPIFYKAVEAINIAPPAVPPIHEQWESRERRVGLPQTLHNMYTCDCQRCFYNRRMQSLAQGAQNSLGCQCNRGVQSMAGGSGFTSLGFGLSGLMQQSRFSPWI